MISVPIGEMVMRISSPIFNVNESGGTMPVPVSRNAPAANVLTADIESLPFQPGSVSTVVLTEVLEHFPNPADVVADLAVLLRPGGICIGSVPSQSLVWQMRFVSGSPAGEPFHKNYSKDELRRLLEREFSNVTVGVGNCSMSVYFVATK